ncbi:MAG: hypothetical protein J5I93_07545 [Pirellulaceae bacterium]|nr:hypothetical protein [Pirellulaceae bacterium]
MKRRHAVWLASADAESFAEVWESLPDELPASDQPQRVLLGALLECLLDLRRRRPAIDATATSAAAAVSSNATQLPPLLFSPRTTRRILARISTLYANWDATAVERHLLLVWLATGRQPAELAELVELLVDDPPADSTQVGRIVAPLIQHADFEPRLLYPRLLAGLRHVSLASAILDMTNFYFRQRGLHPHPAAARSAELVRLLSGLAGQLGQLEVAARRPSDPQPESQPESQPGPESPPGQESLRQPAPVVETSGRRELTPRQVAESVALAISLCDTLALLEEPTAIEPLAAVLELGHRRLRIEAAAALARLGDRRGQQRLIELAAEPVVRRLALAYADELGLGGQIAPSYRGGAALAESDLAAWLAQPTQFGLPPRMLEPFDERTQYWPGFDQQVRCYLVRFTYELADGRYSNIGIAGPLTHAFRADLSDLPPDDIYAAFAGWQAEHADIFQQDAAHLRPRQQAELARLERRLRDAGYRRIEPCLLGHFLGERVLVAAAVRDEQPGIVLIDRDQIEWHPRIRTTWPLGAEEWYSIYKGRRMLRAFNP